MKIQIMSKRKRKVKWKMKRELERGGKRKESGRNVYKLEGKGEGEGREGQRQVGDRDKGHWKND